MAVLSGGKMRFAEGQLDRSLSGKRTTSGQLTPAARLTTLCLCAGSARKDVDRVLIFTSRRKKVQERGDVEKF